MDHNYHIRRFMVALYICTLLRFASEAFVQVVFERLVSPRSSEDCKHYPPRSVTTSTAMVAAKGESKEGAEVVKKSSDLRWFEDLKVGFLSVVGSRGSIC